MFISSLTDSDAVVRGLKLNAIDYITKPFRPEEVLARIERHLTLQCLQKELKEKNRQLEQEVVERRRVEAELRDLTEKLEQMVADRTAQFEQVAQENVELYQEVQQKYEQLRESQNELIQIEKMAALGRLMASITHEINNPLQSIQGFLSLLNKEFEGRHRPEKITFYLGVVTEEIDRVAAILQRMKDFYRPAEHKQAPLPESLDEFYQSTQAQLQMINLHAALDTVLLLTYKKMQHANIVVERCWAKNLPHILGNPDHLKQVFLNITLNAIDAMAETGGTLTIRTGTAVGELQPGPRQPAVRLEFSDTGVGIADEVVAHLFQPMATRKSKGTGFGLYTSHKIVTAHHGKISAASQVGQGTTFTILLPIGANGLGGQADDEAVLAA
jgi:two-component system NtrC family sensor kinase